MLGTDVEFFVQDYNRTTIPALVAFDKARVSGKKFKKVRKNIAGPDFNGYDSLEVRLSHSRVTEDGLAIETPCDPSDSPQVLIQNMREGIHCAIDIARRCDAVLVAAPLVLVNERYIRERPELQVLGCAPDQSLWDRAQGECKPPQDPMETRWRTGGGHIHFSPPGVEFPEIQERIVLLSDLLLGTLDVVLEHSPDAKQRRQMYGQPGKHRIQDWGVEYRTMSNAWCMDSMVAEMVLEVAKLVHDSVEDFDPWPVVQKISPAVLISAITECDQELASRIFLFTVEKMEEQGINVREKISFKIVRKIYQNGGLRYYFGSYTMNSWDY